MSVGDQIIFSCTLTKTTHCNRLNIEADSRIKLSSLKLEIEICKKCKTMLLFSIKLFFILENILIIDKIDYLCIIINLLFKINW